MQPSPTLGAAKRCTACGLAADLGRYCEDCGGDLEEFAAAA